MSLSTVRNDWDQKKRSFRAKKNRKNDKAISWNVAIFWQKRDFWKLFFAMFVCVWFWFTQMFEKYMWESKNSCEMFAWDSNSIEIENNCVLKDYWAWNMMKMWIKK